MSFKFLGKKAIDQRIVQNKWWYKLDQVQLFNAFCFWKNDWIRCQEFEGGQKGA